MRKSKVRETVIALVILAIALFFIAGTYARYSTQGVASGSLPVAKWAVAITSDDGKTLSSTTQDITFTVQSNTNVVSGKIAPAVTAVAEIELDLTGTEVAVDFDAVIGSLTSSGSTASLDKMTLTTEVDGTTYTSGTAQTINLVGDSAFTAANGKKKVTLTVTWENDETNNADDTTMGTTAPTITIPVTLTAKQHIG